MTRTAHALVAPMFIVVSLIFGTAVGWHGYRLGYHLIIVTGMGVFAAYWMKNAIEGRYGELFRRQRFGGMPKFADIVHVAYRVVLVAFATFGVAVIGFEVGIRWMPDGPLVAFGLLPVPNPFTRVDWFVRDGCFWMIGFFVATAFGSLMNRWLFPEQVFEPFSRGRRLLSYPEANQLVESARPHDDPGIFWGGCRVPSASAVLHWLIVGTTGAGKTLLLRLLMQDVLAKIRPGSDARALIYDAKLDLMPILKGINVPCPVKLLNPLDRRGVAWHIARDCTSPATALQIAAVFVPDKDEGANQFFSSAVRDLLAGVFIALHLTAPERWTLRDVILILNNPPLLRTILGRHDATKDRLRYFADERTLANIFATIATKLSPYGPIAAAYDKATNAISLSQWVRGEFILVLGNEESVRTALDAINRAILQRATELILSLPESDTRRTWVILDEVREAGPLNGLRSLLNKGRSKGAAVVLGLQAIEGLRDAYGKDMAHEIVGECSHKAILRLASPETASWAAEVVGEAERLEVKSSQQNPNGPVSRSEDIVRRPVVLPSEFLTIPETNPQNGLTGYFIAPSSGCYRHTISGHELKSKLLPKDPHTEDHLPRPAADQYLRPFDEQDEIRLGFRLLTLPTDSYGSNPTMQTATTATTTVNPPPTKKPLKIVGSVMPSPPVSNS